MHFHFDIEDPRWAIVLAGALHVGRTGEYRAINPQYTVSFELGRNSLVDYIAEAFEIKPVNAHMYSLPKEEQFGFIDYFQASSHAKNLFEQHGIKQEAIIVPLYLQHLASNSILLTHGIASTAAYFVPTPGKSQLELVPTSDAIIETQEMEPIAVAFCKGLGIENPVILCCEDYDPKTIAISLFKTNALVSRPHHYSQYVARSQYTGFDNLHTNVPVVSVIDDTCPHSNRFLVSWNAQLPIFVKEPLETVINKGKAWKVRQNYKFDHREFYKDHAAGTVKQ